MLRTIARCLLSPRPCCSPGCGSVGHASSSSSATVDADVPISSAQALAYAHTVNLRAASLPALRWNPCSQAAAGDPFDDLQCPRLVDALHRRTAAKRSTCRSLCLGSRQPARAPLPPHEDPKTGGHDCQSYCGYFAVYRYSSNSEHRRAMDPQRHRCLCLRARCDHADRARRKDTFSCNRATAHLPALQPRQITPAVAVPTCSTEPVALSCPLRNF